MCHADKRAQHELDRPESHRVFVALKFAPEVLQQLADMSPSLEGSEVRRVAAGDIHLTLVPPWNESAIFSAVSKLPELPNIMILLNYILNTSAMERTQDILGSYGLNAWQAASLANYALRF